MTGGPSQESDSYASGRRSTRRDGGGGGGGGRGTGGGNAQPRRGASRRALITGLGGTALLGLGGWYLASRDRGTEPAATPSASTEPSAAAEPSATFNGPTMGGWYAGASGIGVADGKFARWLGQPVTIAATWADQDDSAQRKMTALTREYRDWDQAIDLAVGGTVLESDENYAEAAKGAYDDRWRSAAQVIAARRGNLQAPTFVRCFHEMNGDWYKNWELKPDNIEAYKASHIRYAKILREAMPKVYITWSPNFRDHSGIPIEQWYPGDEWVDVVAPDYYDDADTDARYSVSAWNAEADDVDKVGNPLGVEAWRRFAEKHGKPLGFPEMGLKPDFGSDHPEWIKAFNAWLNQHPNTATWELGTPIPAEAAGKVLYSCYFNVDHGGDNGFTIYGTGANPNSAKMFRSLRWGRSA